MMNYKELKRKYGTPLYIYDVNKIKDIISAYKNNFQSGKFETEIIYASKAFNIKEMLRLIKNEGLSLDVVSLGELYTATKIGFPMERIYFHGNNKTEEELRFAIEYNVGIFVIDNLSELRKLSILSKELQKKSSIYIRLNVGVEAHTHKYIVTSHIDSKFGVLYGSEEYKQMLQLIEACEQIELKGLHCHIGSQIFELNPYDIVIEKLTTIVQDFPYPLSINLGGGFGAFYTQADHVIPYERVARHLIQRMEEELEKKKLRIQKLSIEPGRSIVGEAGRTLDTLGSTKQTPNRLYYFVDGGMTDNIRPALYQAIYAADVVGKEKEIKNKMVTIAGKCCESGDILVENILLPEAQEGDLLITYSTGAYGYAMSSNYNKACTPAVVFVEDGQDKLVVRRQSMEELIEREI